ncbi:PREDICTED: uncharacterized protein LOC107171357 [Diuraphis noxia]|uniref:uncharacterized protein LOC107171357 n=1 Tax=Diuraphis noxia TaxID=143948 RepID=UPI00076387A4|nr:PREDICTED: uncharacterized protein LOC107171357 [Diuraphis noxia]
MALGDETIYLAEPTSLNIEIDEENINQVGDNMGADLENIEYETISCSFINEDDVSTALTASQQIHKTADVRDLTSSKRPRMLKQKLSTQLQTARNSFNVIAEKQADAMTLMADSLSVIGKALNTIADNDAKRTENDMKMIALYDKILQKL